MGLGVGWEAGLIRRLLYKKKLHNDRIFPICFEASDKQHIPIELLGFDQFLLDGQDGYESLLRRFLDRPCYEQPRPGPAPELPTQATKPRFDRPGGSGSGGSGPSGPGTAEAGLPSLPRRIALSRLLDSVIIRYWPIISSIEFVPPRQMNRYFLHNVSQFLATA